jgi:hypothetical protein
MHNQGWANRERPEGSVVTDDEAWRLERARYIAGGDRAEELPSKEGLLDRFRRLVRL